MNTQVAGEENPVSVAEAVLWGMEQEDFTRIEQHILGSWDAYWASNKPETGETPALALFAAMKEVE